MSFLLISCSPGIQTLIEKKEFEKAETLISQSLVKDSLNLDLIIKLSQILIDETNPSSNAFAAFNNIKKAERIFNNSNSTLKSEYIKKNISYQSISKLKFNIIQFSVFKIKKTKDIDGATAFLSAFDDAPFETKLIIENFRDSLEMEKAKEESSIFYFKQFLKKYPNSIYRKEIINLLDSTSFQFALESESIEFLINYIRDFPDSKYSEEAFINLHKLEFNKVKEENTITAYLNFINQYPNAQQIYEAKKIIEALQFEKAQSLNTVQEYKNFIKSHPESKFVKEAQNAIEFIEFESLSANENCNRIKNFTEEFPNSKFRKQAYERFIDCEYNSNIQKENWESYFRFYHFFKDNPRINQAKDSLLTFCFKSNDLQLVNFAINDLQVNNKELILKYYDFLTSDGEEISIRKYQNKFKEEINEKRIKSDLDIAKEYKVLLTNNIFKPIDIKEHLRFIKKAQNKESGFIALQRGIEEQLWRGDYNKAILFINENEINKNNQKASSLFALMKKNDGFIKYVEMNRGLFNSTDYEYSPSFLKNDNLVLLQSYKGNISSSNNIYVASMIDSTWNITNKLTGNYFKKQNVTLTHSATSFGNDALLVSGGNEFVKYSIANRNDPGEIIHPYEISQEEWRGDGFLTSNGNLIIYSAYIEDAGKNITNLTELPYHGDFQLPSDLYVSQKLDDKTWSKPINLGKSINTRYSERYPFLTPDLKTLYFSSDGHGGLGRLDIYMSTRLREDCWDCWTEPINLGPPVNSPGNDVEFRLNFRQDLCCMTREYPQNEIGSDVEIILSLSNRSRQSLGKITSELNSLHSRLNEQNISVSFHLVSNDCSYPILSKLKSGTNLQALQSQLDNNFDFENNVLFRAYNNVTGNLLNEQSDSKLTNKHIVIISDGSVNLCGYDEKPNNLYSNNKVNLYTTILKLPNYIEYESFNQYFNDGNNTTITTDSDQDLKSTFELLYASILLFRNQPSNKDIKIFKKLN